MSKPVFNPTQYELRNELPAVVSVEQLAQITQTTDRVNVQLNWVAQILGWNGPNYWTNLPSTVSQKRALLGGSFGVYNSFTLLRLKEVRSWVPCLVTEKKPNIAIGQRVIIGDQQTYIYNLTEEEDSLLVNIGEISSAILSLLEAGAAIKVDCKENRPFPFYRPEPLASGDADFRCTTGRLLLSSPFYEYYELSLSPFQQQNAELAYRDVQLYGGSYYYFDRAVYLSADKTNLVPWVECQWIESKGLWELYVPPEPIGNELYIVWPYASLGKKAIAYTSALVIQWTDPSDWGAAGQGFNPILDTFSIEKSYDIAGLNFSLGTYLWLGDQPPLTANPLWFDAGSNVLYSQGANGDWVPSGEGTAFLNLQNQSAPPPYTYDIKPGTVWQDPTGRVYIWDTGYVPATFYYFFASSFTDGFIYFDPNSQNVQGLYIFNPDNFFIHKPDGLTSEGLVFFNTLLEDGFYINNPDEDHPDWFLIDFYNTSLQSSVFTPAYASNLVVQVNGEPIPEVYSTDEYLVEWAVIGDYLTVRYKALSNEGQLFVPTITVASNFGANTSVIDISDDFQARKDIVTSIPYNEEGVLNNFLGVWGNKGGARPLDFVFDSLSIHGFNEREALFLEPVRAVLGYDWVIGLVTGAKCFVGDLPPQNARVGDYYWNTETGAFSTLYVDRDRNLVWVEIDYPISVCQVGTPDCDFFPLKPIPSFGTCVLDNGDLWQDPTTPGVAMYYESPNGVDTWVETNWNSQTLEGWTFSQFPNPLPDYDGVIFYISDDFIPLSDGEPYENENYKVLYEALPLECAFVFSYTALSDLGVQKFPTVWVGPRDGQWPPVNITEEVFSNAKFYIAPAVQNAGVTLRPWKTRSLEVADGKTLDDKTYFNPLVADDNEGPGDENWDRSFIRLPSEYARNSTPWNQAKLTVQDFTYAGTDGKLKEMSCPELIHKPQIYEELVFYNRDPSIGTTVYSEPYLFSDVQGFYNLSEYFNGPFYQGEYQTADFYFATDYEYDEWTEADLSEYEPLHFRNALDSGDWEGVYLEPTGNRPVSGFVERDLRVKSLITVPPPVWDASIYKYPPLCSFGPETYAEDPNNCKVGYAYFAADLAGAEDGFFDQQQDVSWREPLNKGQTLYITD